MEMKKSGDKKQHKSVPILIWLLPLSAIAMSLFGYLEADGVYHRSEVDLLKTPGFTVVLEGVRDGIYPFTLLPAKEQEADKAGAEALSAKESVKQQEADGSGDKALPAEEPKKEQKADEAGEEAHKARTEITVKTEGVETKAEEKSESISESGPDSVSESIDVDMTVYEVPEESGCPVFGAYDYGNASAQYRGPADWSPEKNTEGMFAATGPFYELGEVDESYFADALYIGDSRVDGLCDYGDLEDYATFACRDSLTIYKLFDESLRFSGPGGIRGYASLSEILSFRSYGKIYLQIGINEVGTGNTKQFYEEYQKVLMKLRAAQPLADLYIDGIMHVTASRSSSDPVLNNVNIVERNRAISTLANGRDIFYIDMNPVVCDEKGNLLSELSMDNAHLKASAHSHWREFLLTHAALKQTAFLPAEGRERF